MFKLETAASGPLSISGLLLSGYRGRVLSLTPCGWWGPNNQFWPESWEWK